MKNDTATSHGNRRFMAAVESDAPTCCPPIFAPVAIAFGWTKEIGAWLQESAVCTGTMADIADGLA
jgi:hypothetical protein